jgi:DNA-3-methyladenine glycosylase II
MVSAKMATIRQHLRYDPALACEQLAKADRRLGALIERAGPYAIKIRSSHSPFEALLESILYQQLHGKAAAAILKRLLFTFGDMHPQPEQLLAAPDERLRAAGVSRNKILALRDLAQKTLDGTVPSLARIRRMPDAEILERLTEVRGVGTWTAEMLLIFRLGRPDVFPITDYGVRKGFLLTFGKRLPPGKPVSADMFPPIQEMLSRAERWKPWRSIASWYLWRACDLHAGRIPDLRKDLREDFQEVSQKTQRKTPTKAKRASDR